MHTEELDIRSLSPFNLKKSIISNLDRLKPDQRMVIIFNYNPADFISLLDKTRKYLYTVSTLREGPPEWHLEYTINSPDFTINELLDQNPSSIEIFELYGIPYFHMGSRMVADFLRNKHITPRDFVMKALSHKNQFFDTIKPGQWDTGFLISFILENHHKNLQGRIYNLNEKIKSLYQLHGAAYPLFKALKDEFGEFMSVQKDHLEEEEQHFFPMILESVKNNSQDSANTDKIIEDINWLAEDHQAIAENLHNIRKITNHFVSPDESIFEITLLFDDLRSLESDYHYHMLLENFYLPRKLKNPSDR